MLTAPAQFIPTAEHADRISRRLHQCYPQHTFAVCQDALARMYGHSGAGELKEALAFIPSALDEQCTSEVVVARVQQQYDAALVTLAGLDDRGMLAAQELDQELLSVGPDSIGKRYHPDYNQKRIARARYALSLAYARHVVLEIRPTAGSPIEIPEDDDSIDLSGRIDLLPRALEDWLAHHQPALAAEGARIGRLRVRQHCATELLTFSFAWGEFCLYHSIEIPKCIQVYPIALCAKWFAWLACSREPQLQPVIAKLENQASREAVRRAARKLIEEAVSVEETRLMLAQPREDFRVLSASAREQQIHAGFALVRRSMADAASQRSVKEILEKRSFWPRVTRTAPA